MRSGFQFAVRADERDRVGSGSAVSQRPAEALVEEQEQQRYLDGFCETEPILPMRRIGFVCAKPVEVVCPPRLYQLSKIMVAEPLARMLPLLHHCAE